MGCALVQLGGTLDCKPLSPTWNRQRIEVGWAVGFALASSRWAYDVDASADDWVATGCGAVVPTSTRALAWRSSSPDRPSGDLPKIVQRHHLGIPLALEALYSRVFATMDPAFPGSPFSRGPCVTGSQSMGRRDEFRYEPHMKKHVQQFGMFI